MILPRCIVGAKELAFCWGWYFEAEYLAVYCDVLIYCWIGLPLLPFYR